MMKTFPQEEVGLYRILSYVLQAASYPGRTEQKYSLFNVPMFAFHIKILIAFMLNYHCCIWRNQCEW